MRIGSRMVTALWGDPIGGLFVLGRRGARHWTWAEVWVSLTSGREGAAAT